MSRYTTATRGADHGSVYRLDMDMTSTCINFMRKNDHRNDYETDDDMTTMSIHLIKWGKAMVNFLNTWHDLDLKLYNLQ